jgi:hypothetical protein
MNRTYKIKTAALVTITGGVLITPDCLLRRRCLAGAREGGNAGTGDGCNVDTREGANARSELRRPVPGRRCPVKCRKRQAIPYRLL